MNHYMKNLAYLFVFLLACSDEPVRPEDPEQLLSTPEWIQGKWTNPSRFVVFEFTPDNVIMTERVLRVDFSNLEGVEIQQSSRSRVDFSFNVISWDCLTALGFFKRQDGTVYHSYSERSLKGGNQNGFFYERKYEMSLTKIE